MEHTRIVVTRYGGPEELRVVKEQRPEPRQGEVRVKVLAAGVCLPDLMMREGIHPETPRLPFTPGWDLVGAVDCLGDGVAGFQLSQVVAALPIHGAYAEFVCLPQSKPVPVPSGVDAAEAVSLILNYITAYQMMHRTARVQPGQRVLIHGAAGGVGTALLQLGRLARLEMYGTCSPRSGSVVSNLGATPIDYQNQDFVKEIARLTGDGVDVVFESIGGTHTWRTLGFGAFRTAASLPGGCHLRFLYCCRLGSSWQEACSALQHPMARTAEARILPPGLDRAVQSASATEDQAAGRTADGP